MIGSREIQELLLSLPPFLFAITIHEVAHGYVAYRKGDHTARLLGRLSLNPIRHLDPVGSVLFPVLLALSHVGVIFGWAKPVPINPYHFRSPRRDMVTVSLAGPASNMASALVFALALRLLHWYPGTDALWSSQFLAPLGIMILMGIKISVVLAVFNLVPIHPLDGSHVLEGILPADKALAYGRLAPYGWVILMALMFTGILNRFISPVYNVIFYAISRVFGI